MDDRRWTISSHGPSSIVHRLFFLCLFWMAVAPCHAALVRVEKIAAGLDGYARAERWVPVVFQARNYGDNFQGSIEVLKGDTVFRKSLDLAPGAAKQVELLIYFSNFYEPLTFQLMDGRSHKLQDGKIDIRSLNYTDNLVLVISESEYNHQFLNGEQNPWGGKTFVAYRKPADLYSEYIAYSAADAIALGSLSTHQILPSQWRALMQAIASGKPLVCSAATDLAVLQDPLLKDHLPAIDPQLSRTSNGDFLLARWSSHSTTDFPAVSIPAQVVRPRGWDREVLAFVPGQSLITASPYYKGSIIYFAFDYTRLPESIRSIFSGFWNESIYESIYPSPSASSTGTGTPAFSLPFRKRLEENIKVQKSLYNIPGLHLPELKWFALFFFLYLFAVGPLQYLLLRLLKKTSLLWITFPAIILLFSVGSFGYSHFRHNSEDRVNQIAVIELFPDLHQQITYQVYGMTMSRTGVFDFEAVPSNGYLRKFVMQSLSYQPEPYTLSEDLPRSLVNESLKNWTFRTFESISAEPAALPISVVAHITAGRLSGTIVNRSDIAFSDASFYYDSRNFTRLGPVPARGNREFAFLLDDSSTPGAPEQQLRELTDLFSSTYSTPHFFYGEAVPATGSLIISGKLKPTVLDRYVAVYVDIEAVGPANGWAFRSYPY